MSKYNEQPKGWKEISDADFVRLFFMYIFKDSETRQMRRDADGKPIPYEGTTRLWEVKYGGWEGLGVGIRYDYATKRIKYFRYGEDELWRQRNNEFAAQFANDNS